MCMIDWLPDFGSTLWTLLAFVVALSVVVTVHEFGHYIVGRWSGIRAEVFSVGFGPRLFAVRDRRGTLWQVAAIPLGGYVKFAGDANAASMGSRTDGMSARQRSETMEGAGLWARFATVAAGPVFNFILSVLIFGGVAMFGGIAVDQVRVGSVLNAPPGVPNELRAGDEILAVGGQVTPDWSAFFKLPQTLNPGPQDWLVLRDGARTTVRGPDPSPARIGNVGPGSAADDAGILAGDVVLSVDGTPVSRFADLRERVGAAEGAPIALRIWRDGTGEVALTVAARETDVPNPGGGFSKRWLLGVTGGEGYFTPATRMAGPVEALQLGVTQVWDVIVQSLSGLWAMVTGAIDSCNLRGAITIADTTGAAASAGLQTFIWWIGMLSTAIGFLNLLPIPVLDGGHLALYLFEGVARRPPSPQVVNVLSFMGMALVIGLMLFGLTNDIICP
ncbi:RIP metalloprotease RseP [Paracoccus pacificus]|uniref:Zinc metalloprotease n=1 Tax=Paracoccus pacificus TaxID=1463598 RepID=A0ABW4R4A8_9RHOB